MKTLVPEHNISLKRLNTMYKQFVRNYFREHPINVSMKYAARNGAV